jgi:hypothetical protein
VADVTACGLAGMPIPTFGFRFLRRSNLAVVVVVIVIVVVFDFVLFSAAGASGCVMMMIGAVLRL